MYNYSNEYKKEAYLIAIPKHPTLATLGQRVARLDTATAMAGSGASGSHIRELLDRVTQRQERV